MRPARPESRKRRPMSQEQSPAPLLIVPFVWIGDFVRVHSVVRLLQAQDAGAGGGHGGEHAVRAAWPTTCRACARRLWRTSRAGGWGWRSSEAGRRAAGASTTGRRSSCRASGRRRWRRGWPASRCAPASSANGATGCINDMRYGEKKLPRMIDQMGALALPAGAALPEEWPLPELKVPARGGGRVAGAAGLGEDERPIVTLSPGAVGEGKAWPPEHYAELARALVEGRRVGLGAGRAEREANRAADRRRQRRARSDRQRSAQRHSRHGCGRRGGHQRFRPDARVGGDRHADRRHFRADQPVALEAAQPGGGDPGAARRRGGERARARHRQRGGRASPHRRCDRSTRVLAAVRGVLP